MKQEISVMFDSRDWFVDTSEAQKKCAFQLCFASRLWLPKTKVLKTNKRKSFDLCRQFDSVFYFCSFCTLFQYELLNFLRFFSSCTNFICNAYTQPYLTKVKES